MPDQKSEEAARLLVNWPSSEMDLGMRRGTGSVVFGAVKDLGTELGPM